MPRICRHDVLFAVLAAVVVGLTVRLGSMINQHLSPVTQQQAEVAGRVARSRGGQKMTLPIPARPGDIYARSRHSHVLIAGSRQVGGCFVDPKLLSNRELGEVAGRLGEILDSDPGEIYRKLLARRSRRFVWIAKQITPPQIRAIRQLRNRAVGIQYEWKREYPNGPVAGTVVGFCRQDGRPGNGLELHAHEILAPHDGKRVLLGDARRRPIRGLDEASVAPRDGRSVYLSIDVVIQEYLQQAVGEAVEKFDAHWGTGVVINPWTGDVLAMCSAPTYDPNRYNRTPPGHMLNRAISCPFEPGSVFKPIVAAAAVEEGVADYQTQIYCENGVYHARRGGRISDHGEHHAHLSLRDVVVYSSNIGMAKVGEKLGNARLWNLARRWGFSRRTGLPLPAETGGILRRLDKWDGYSLRRVPFGQEISTSALQITMAFGSIANGGLLMKPRLIQQIADSRGRIIHSPAATVVRRVISAEVARQSRSVLQEVVTRGTGKNARMSRWSCWGKTGTAQVPGPQGYIDDAYVGSFVGAAPADKPAVVCLISIYRPDRRIGYYGSTVAAPYVKEVLKKTLTYLSIPPDQPGSMVAATAR